ncbi:hypothetical protein Dimus_007784, partial [Dionaea muscipula]
KGNVGITELFEHLESKIFTDNQREKLSYAKLKEIKTYLDNLSEELKNISFILKKTMLQVADLLSGKIKDHSSLIVAQDRREWKGFLVSDGA